MTVTVCNSLWSRHRRRHRGWLAVFVTAALVALFFGVCDSGGHHRAPVPAAAASQATAAHPELAGGCPGGNHPCVHADEHTAVQLPERGEADGASVLRLNPVQAGASRPSRAAAAAPPRSSSGSGRDLLCKACVSRT